MVVGHSAWLYYTGVPRYVSLFLVKKNRVIVYEAHACLAKVLEWALVLCSAGRHNEEPVWVHQVL